MKSITVPKELSDVDKTIFLVKVADRAYSLTRQYLHKVFTDGTWEGRFSSWSDFVQSGLGKSKGWASKNLAVYEYYELQGGVSHEKLEIDTEKLYYAMRLKGKPEEQAEKANALNRSEINSELAVKENGEEHDFDPYTLCRVCHRPEGAH